MTSRAVYREGAPQGASTLAPIDIDQALDLIALELTRAERLHGPMPSAHHALSVIHEEFLEVRSEVYRQRPDRKRLTTELVQLGAMCVRALLDLGLLDVEAE